jgi:hypothetical protein
LTQTDFIGYAFAALVTVSCARHLAKGGLKEDFSVFKGRQPKVWAEVIVGNLAAIAIVLAIADLIETQSKSMPVLIAKFLSWSWLDLFAENGKAGHGFNQNIAGATIPFFGVFFVILLFLNLPRLAEAEESSFRQGTKNWWHAVPRSIGFGLVHLVVGVPVWLALSLAIPGMWFTSQYFKGGISRSSMAHGLYNMVIASALFVYVLLDNVSSIKFG